MAIESTFQGGEWQACKLPARDRHRPGRHPDDRMVRASAVGGSGREGARNGPLRPRGAGCAKPWSENRGGLTVRELMRGPPLRGMVAVAVQGVLSGMAAAKQIHRPSGGSASQRGARGAPLAAKGARGLAVVIKQVTPRGSRCPAALAIGNRVSRVSHGTIRFSPFDHVKSRGSGAPRLTRNHPAQA